MGGKPLRHVFLSSILSVRATAAQSLPKFTVSGSDDRAVNADCALEVARYRVIIQSYEKSDEALEKESDTSRLET